MTEPARNLSETDAGRRLAPGRAAELLRELQAAHDELAAALAALDEITSSERPDLARYPHARWRLSSARRRRGAVAATIHSELAGTLAPEESERVERLRADDTRRLSASALHVQQWTSERIAADWAGYRAASATMRAALRALIAAERALLFPLLERLSRPA